MQVRLCFQRAVHFCLFTFSFLLGSERRPGLQLFVAVVDFEAQAGGSLRDRAAIILRR